MTSGLPGADMKLDVVYHKDNMDFFVKCLATVQLCREFLNR